jgi:hypothetical protein
MAAVKTIFGVNSLMKPEPLRALWSVSEEECRSVAEPLEGWLRQLSPEALKKVERYAYPVMTAIAISGITLPRFVAEMQYAKAVRTANVKTPVGGSQSAPSPVQSDLNGAGEVQESAAERILRSMRQ